MPVTLGRPGRRGRRVVLTEPLPRTGSYEPVTTGAATAASR